MVSYGDYCVIHPLSSHWFMLRVTLLDPTCSWDVQAGLHDQQHHNEHRYLAQVRTDTLEASPALLWHLSAR